MTSKKFIELVAVYKKVVLKPSSMEGSLYLSDESECNNLKELLTAKDRFGITLEQGTIASGNTVLISITHPITRLGRVYPTVSDFLENNKNRIREPNEYFILDEKYYCKDTITPSAIQSYRCVLRLLSLLKQSAALLDESNYELVYFDKEVFKIIINYDINDLKKINITTVDTFISSFTDDTHRDQKLSILANAVKFAADSQSKESAFSKILSDIENIINSFKKGYNLFSSGFSYEKIIDQLRAAKVEEMGKIHKTFSDIQNQVLGLPLATVIVATQMKESIDWSVQSLINTSILLGAIIFVALISLALFNQWQTLKAIKEEIKYKKNQAQTTYKSIYSDIESTFSHLTTRIMIQYFAFIVIGLAVFIGLVLTFKFYFQLTPYALQYLKNLWPF
ncbi:hypothetical protein NG99_23670 [Erwinia typographi]|uniref:Phage-related membrane protein n=2 Tax=Erwinia typographi TaxID=371042 RepID=A0A0A3YPG8_9GAMM|nr:hypothetical protein NG99_23670 [Erwinia typographi]